MADRDYRPVRRTAVGLPKSAAYTVEHSDGMKNGTFKAKHGCFEKGDVDLLGSNVSFYLNGNIESN